MEFGGRAETIQTTALLWTVRIQWKELKKLWNMKVTIVPIVIGALGTITKWLLKGLEDLERGYPNDSIAKSGQSPESSPGDLRWLAVTQNPVKTIS